MTTGRRWWPQDLDEREAAALARRDDPEHLRPDVLVVGGGILGVAIASALESADAGFVVLVERGQLGSGSTGGAAGLLTPEPHHGVDPPPLAELGRESLGRWRALDAEVPGGVGLLELDWLALLRDGEDISRRSPQAVLVEPDEVARLVPGLRSPMWGMRIVGQARVNPLRALSRLAGQLRSVATGVGVTGVSVRRGRITAVETTAGRLSPGAVVFATGGPPFLDGLDVAVPADFVRGHILVTEPVDVVLPGTVDPVCTQLEDGRLIVGGTVDRGEDDPNIDLATVERLVDDLAYWTSALEAVRVADAWCCFRPHHPDDLPTIDRVRGVDNAWFTSGHYKTGILMAPATAAVVSEWLVSGRAPGRARPFSVERFA